nr:reverse transcriptase domain-containing protein [Tanacetum cinerariifolium]
MSSPNNPTSNIEDAFSSNFPNYILASPDYVLASPGKIYSSFSNKSFGLVQIALPTLSLLHDDPYIKVMHAYYAKESSIPPPVIMPPSPMLSPMFNPQEFFLPEKLLPPKKRGCLESHEEQIEEILNHIDELSLDRIENIEDNIEVAKHQRKQLGQNNKIDLARFRVADLEQIIKEIQDRYQADKESLLDNAPKRTSTSAAPAMTQAANRQLVADSVTTSLEAQATNMENTKNTNRNPRPREAPVARKCSYKEFMSCQPFNFKGSKGAVGLIRWFKHTESVFSRRNCIEDCKVKFATGTLTEEAISWWNFFAQPIGIEKAYKITWVEFKKLLIKNLPSEWKTHTLIWRNKANLEEHSLDDLFNSLRIYEAKVKHSSTPGNPTQNLAFVLSSNTDSTTDSFSAATSVSAIDVDDLKEMDLRWQMAMLTMRARRECRSPKDAKRTGAAEPQRRHVLVETSTSNALVSQCDGIGSCDWSYQADEEPANFALMPITSSSSSFDNEVQSCSKACSKAYDQLHSQYDKLTVEFRKSQIDVLLYQAGLESVEARHVMIQLNGGYNVVPPPITGNFMPPKPDLVFHTTPIAVETNHLAFTVFDLEDESEPNDPQSVPSFDQTFEHVKPSGHSVQHVEAPILPATPKPTSPKTNCSGKRKNRKTCFVCRSVDHLIKDCNFHAKPKTQPIPRNYAHRGYNNQHASFTKKYPQKHIFPAAVLTKSKPVSVTAARPVSAAIPKIMITRPRHAHSLIRHKTRSQSSTTSNSSLKVTAAKALVVSAFKGKKEKWVL